MNIEDLVLPNELRNLNEHSKSLVLDFPKLDKVAEVALRKYRVRGGLQAVSPRPWSQGWCTQGSQGFAVLGREHASKAGTIGGKAKRVSK